MRHTPGRPFSSSDKHTHPPTAPMLLSLGAPLAVALVGIGVLGLVSVFGRMEEVSILSS